MTNVRRSIGPLLAVLLCAGGAGAQQTPPPRTAAAIVPQAPSPGAAAAAARPATTTFLGDTGVWFVPTAEVLPDLNWSATGYRRGTNYIQGYTSVADFAGTFAVGLADRVEVFGSVLAVTTVDRDLHPVFVNDPAYGGFVDRYPRAVSSAPVNSFGDSYVGVKVNLMSEYRGYPAALAVRSVVKLPTADDGVGAGTGKADLAIEAVGSKEIAQRVELAALLGYTFQGQTAGFTTPSGAFEWGAAAAYPSRGTFRVFGEANGVLPSSDMASRTVPLVGIDGSVAPAFAATENLTRITTGLTWQMRGGLFVGAGVSWMSPRRERIDSSQTDHTFGDYRDWQVRIGFHPGVHGSARPQATGG